MAPCFLEVEKVDHDIGEDERYFLSSPNPGESWWMKQSSGIGEVEREERARERECTFMVIPRLECRLWC